MAPDEKQHRAPAFQLFPTDVLGSQAWTLMLPEARGGFCALMLHAWNPLDGAAPGYLPNDPLMLAALSGLGVDGWQRCGTSILRAFTVEGDHLRLDWMADYAVELDAYRTQAAAAGRRGAAKRWKADRDPNSPPIGDPNGDPAKKNDTPTPTPTPDSGLRSSSPSLITNPDHRSEEDPAAGAADLLGAAPSSPVGTRKKTKPKADPLPFTIGEALEVICAASGDRVVVAPFVDTLAPALTKTVRAVPSLADWKLAGEWIAAGGLAWEHSQSKLDLSWLSTRARLASAVGHARKWSADGRPAITRSNGKAAARGYQETASRPATSGKAGW